MEITIRNLQTKIPIRLPVVKQIVQRAFAYLGQTDGDVSVVFVSAQRMKLLNARHLNHHYSTDILTFDYRRPGDLFLIAEIVICPSVAKHNALLFQKSVAQEIALYLVHGALHLMGFNDHSDKEKTQMRKKEEEVLSCLFTRGG